MAKKKKEWEKKKVGRPKKGNKKRQSVLDKEISYIITSDMFPPFSFKGAYNTWFVDKPATEEEKQLCLDLLNNPDNQEVKFIGGEGLEKGKIRVLKFLQGILMDFTISQACARAGISKKQFTDFLGRNPEFSGVLNACRENIKMIAKETVYENIHTDPQMAFSLLKSRERERYAVDSGNKMEVNNFKNVVYIEKSEKDALENHITEFIEDKVIDAEITDSTE